MAFDCLDFEPVLLSHLYLPQLYDPTASLSTNPHHTCIMIPFTPTLFSACKLVFIAFLLFTMLFIVMLSNGIITKRSARVALSTSDLHGLNGGDRPKSMTFGFWTLH